MAATIDVAILATIQERMDAAERRRRRPEIEEARGGQAAGDCEDADVAAALAEFDVVCEALAPREQARVLELLIARVDHDGECGSAANTFHLATIAGIDHEFVKRNVACA